MPLEYLWNILRLSYWLNFGLLPALNEFIFLKQDENLTQNIKQVK